MKFLELIGEDEAARAVAGSGDPDITGLDYDSRRIEPGFAFVAMRGESADGNRFIDAAIARGAVAVVTDSPSEAPRPGLAWARAAHGRRALAALSARFYGAPARQLHLSGVTGTNGKTTTTFLLEAIFRAAQRKTVLVGTIEYHVAGEVLEAPHTTPEALDLNRLFARGVAAGATEGVMEASSHALAQERTWGLPFEVAIFTNLTRDHLDYHHDFESYFQAKLRLFTGLGAPAPRVAVVNREDPYAGRLIAAAGEAGSEACTYGLEHGDFCARDLQLGREGLQFTLETPAGEVRMVSPLLGRVNAQNILAAAAAAAARGCSLEQIAQGVAELGRVPGRFERVDCGQPFTVVVDYAHTDDALRNLTALAREFVRNGPGGRVLTLFGCGGDRDRSKRPRMGAAAGEGSDFVVLTSDNPRSEAPEAILAEAKPGLEGSGTRFTVEADRRRAIGVVLSEAKPGDIVLIAGKGHEKVQVLRSGPVKFDDVEEARQALAKLGHRAAPGVVR